MTGFSARELASGRSVALAPDGLTWVPPPRHREFGRFEEAAAYAFALNEWLDRMPDPDRLDADRPGGTSLIDLLVYPAAAELERSLIGPYPFGILARLAGPYDDRLPAERMRRPFDRLAS